MRFELSTLPRNCSRDEIIAEIQRVDSVVNKDILTQHEYDQHGKMSASGIKNRFGDWQKALIAAGLGHKYSGRTISEKMRRQNKSLSDADILNELKRIATKLAQIFVSQDNVDKNSEIISASTVIYRFGSWEKGLKKAGLENSPGYRGKFTDEEYF